MNEDLYLTKDLYIAAFLEAKGIKLDHAGKLVNDNGSKSTLFCFKKLEKIEELVAGFYNGNESVNAFKFTAAIKECKALIYNLC